MYNQGYGNEYDDYYGEYDEENGEEYKDMSQVKPKKGKKSKKTANLMSYEEDLSAEEDDDLKKALAASMANVEPPRPKQKQAKKPKVDIDEAVVLSICEQFKGDNNEDFFSIVQVRDTLIANENDIDKSMSSLQQRYE